MLPIGSALSFSRTSSENVSGTWKGARHNAKPKLPYSKFFRTQYQIHILICYPHTLWFPSRQATVHKR